MPVEDVVDVVRVEQGVHAFLQPPIVPLRRITEVEARGQFTRRDIREADTRTEIDDLETRRGEVVVAGIPSNRVQFRE